MASSAPFDHHKKLDYCLTRLKYRQGRELKAVKVYSVVNESKYILVFGVPRINLKKEVQKLFTKYGKLESIIMVTEAIAGKMNIEQFTDVYKLQFDSIRNARRAKRFLDAKSFYGGTLHISYAPEYETVDDLREKFHARKIEVQRQVNKLKAQLQRDSVVMNKQN